MDREDSMWCKGISYFCGECGAQLGVEVTQPNHSCTQFLRAKNATLRADLQRCQEYINMRIELCRQAIHVEVLAGNTVKESNERSALAELLGVKDALATPAGEPTEGRTP